MGARLERELRGLDAYVERFWHLVGGPHWGSGDTLAEGEVPWGDALHSPGGAPRIFTPILP